MNGFVSDGEQTGSRLGADWEQTSPPPPSVPFLLLDIPRCSPQRRGSVSWLPWRAPSLLP